MSSVDTHAHHESGHATLARSASFYVLRIVLDEHAGFTDWEVRPGADPITIAACHLAGPMAEVMHMRCPFDLDNPSWRSDLRAIREVLRSETNDGLLQMPDFERVVEKTRRVLEQNWPDVQNLAQRLIDNYQRGLRHTVALFPRTRHIAQPAGRRPVMQPQPVVFSPLVRDYMRAHGIPIV